MWVASLYPCIGEGADLDDFADLDLEVEEEEEQKGIEPPAYWPSRDGSVVVENLTCRYAPQVREAVPWSGYCIADHVLPISLIPCYGMCRSLSLRKRRSVYAVELGAGKAVCPLRRLVYHGANADQASALALSFFRFLHQESGSIVIDGLDISKLSLTTLRSRLTILPQGESSHPTISSSN